MALYNETEFNQSRPFQQGIKLTQNLKELIFPLTLPQQTVTNNYYLFFISYDTPITSLSIYGGSVIGVLLLGIIVEMLHFIKWYMIVRKRITTNCLLSLVVDLHKDTDKV